MIHHVEEDNDVTKIKESIFKRRIEESISIHLSIVSDKPFYRNSKQIIAIRSVKACCNESTCIPL